MREDETKGKWDSLARGEALRCGYRKLHMADISVRLKAHEINTNVDGVLEDVEIECRRFSASRRPECDQRCCFHAIEHMQV